MSSSPPPPYSLRPPPYVRPRGQRKPPPKPSRPSSRELLTEALRRAQHAVTLDSNEAPSDVPAAIAAYDEAIGLLKRVIERRSQRPGNASEVERVRDIVRVFPFFFFFLPSTHRRSHFHFGTEMFLCFVFSVSTIDTSSAHASSAASMVYPCQPTSFLPHLRLSPLPKIPHRR